MKNTFYLLIFFCSFMAIACQKKEAVPDQSTMGSEETLTDPGITTCYYPGVNVTTFAGNGTPATRDGSVKEGTLVAPRVIARFQNIIYFSEGRNLRKVQTSTLYTIYNIPSSAEWITQITTDYDGNIYTAHANSIIRKLSPAGVVLATYGTPGVAGYSLTAPFRFNSISGLATDIENRLYILDAGNSVILRLNTDGTLQKIAGQPGLSGWVDGSVATARIDRRPVGIAVDTYGTKIFFADEGKVRVIVDGGISTIAGTRTRSFVEGHGAISRFGDIYGLALDALGNLYVTEISVSPTGILGGSRVRKIIKMTTGIYAYSVTTIAGSYNDGYVNGPGADARFQFAKGIVVSSDIKYIYVADEYNHRIRKLSLTCAPAF